MTSYAVYDPASFTSTAYSRVLDYLPDAAYIDPLALDATCVRALSVTRDGAALQYPAGFDLDAAVYDLEVLIRSTCRAFGGAEAGPLERALLDRALCALDDAAEAVYVAAQAPW